MSANSQLSWSGRIFVSAVVATGAAAIILSGHQVLADRPPLTWLILAAFTLISGSLTINVPGVTATISVSEMFVLTAVLFYGTAPATLVVGCDGLMLSIRGRSGKLHKFLFNFAGGALSLWVASHVFFRVTGFQPVWRQASPIGVTSLLAPLALLATVYFLLNSWLNAIAIGLEKRTSPFEIWRRHFLFLSLNYFSGASVALLLVRNTGNSLDPVGFAIILPLLVISYLTNKYSMGRIEDATRHITQLNSLYLSTIETLAMAIDAKDQITHGHIRRVQLYAVSLAKALGVHEEPQLKAVEAAALLHDTGKLAVPEYILNKPGRLTPAEFDKMKLHATVGADILSSIDFPYPVVPIVRHHHENWDGTGYPAGLRGPDIPMGARILAVADCFDALTSDRPYRPKLGDAEALQILLERRGTMYDPLVVDTFLRIFRDIKTEEDDAQPSASGLNEITRSTNPADIMQAARLDDIAASAEEMLALYDLARALGGRTGLADAGDMIAKHLQRIVPASLCAFYLADVASGDLVACHAAGSDAPCVAGLRIPIGQRVTGWVAANRRTIINSDPILDFGDVARSGRPRLRSSLSTPLIADDELVGVLTLYSPNPNVFTDEHRRIIEAVGRQISCVVRDSAEFDRENSTFRDALTGLPNVERLKQLAASGMGLSGEASSQPLSLLFIDVDHLREVNARAGRDAGDALLAHIAHGIRRALRSADILFRYGGDEFVVLLSHTDRETAQAVANRVRTILGASPYSLPDGSLLPTAVAMAIASHPADGTSLADLLVAARQRVEVATQVPPLIAPHVH